MLHEGAQMTLKAVSRTPLPGPPYPADTQVGNYQPMIDLQRLFFSDTWILAEDEVQPWLLRIWFTSWLSTPCGSYPANDKLICKAIRASPQFFKGYRDDLMRGWILHSDDRLYHPYITDQVLVMLDRRNSTRMRTAKYREKKVACEKSQPKQVGDGETAIPLEEESSGCDASLTRESRVGHATDKDKDKELKKEEEKEKREVKEKNEKDGLGLRQNPAKKKRAPHKKNNTWILPGGIDSQIWEDFLADRAERKIKTTNRQKTMAANVLLKFPGDSESQRRCVDATIAAAYPTLYEERGHDRANKPRTIHHIHTNAADQRRQEIADALDNSIRKQCAQDLDQGDFQEACGDVRTPVAGFIPPNRQR